MRRLRFLAEAAMFRVLLGLGRILPMRLLHALGAGAGTLGSLIDRRHDRIGRENLAAAFPEKSEAERRRILAACWRHFGTITLDALAFPRRNREEIGGWIRVVGLENARQAFAKDKGVLIFSGHYGHWELAALITAMLGHRLALIARPLDNPILDRMLARLRGSTGNLVVSKREAMRDMIRALKRNEGVAVMIDQDQRHMGVFVPFFGRPASTTPGLALLALRTGAPVLPVFCTPDPEGGWTLAYHPELTYEATGNRDADVLALTARCTAYLEREIRRRPEIWLWMHRRWKTQPPAPPA